MDVGLTRQTDGGRIGYFRTLEPVNSGYTED